MSDTLRVLLGNQTRLNDCEHLAGASVTNLYIPQAAGEVT